MDFEQEYVYHGWWGWRRAKGGVGKDTNVLSTLAQPYLKDEKEFLRLRQRIEVRRTYWWVSFFCWLFNVGNYAVLRIVLAYCEYHRRKSARSAEERLTEQNSEKQQEQHKASSSLVLPVVENVVERVKHSVAKDLQAYRKQASDYLEKNPTTPVDISAAKKKDGAAGFARDILSQNGGQALDPSFSRKLCNAFDEARKDYTAKDHTALSFALVDCANGKIDQPMFMALVRTVLNEEKLIGHTIRYRLYKQLEELLRLYEKVNGEVWHLVGVAGSPELRAARAELQKARAELQKARAELQKARAEIAALTAEKKVLTEKIAQLTQQVKDFEKKLEDQEKVHKEAKEKLEKDLEEQKKNLEDIQRELDIAIKNAAHSKAQARASSAETQVAATQRALEKLKAEGEAQAAAQAAAEEAQMLVFKAELEAMRREFLDSVSSSQGPGSNPHGMFQGTTNPEVSSSESVASPQAMP